MIYTVTLNPSLDYTMRLSSLTAGEVNRSASEEVTAGGKGINVSATLAGLGVRSRALGFVAGFTGQELARLVGETGVEADFIELSEGATRINVKLKAAEETDINGSGAEINEEALARLFERLDALKSGDTLVLAGSVPRGVPRDIYERILARLDGKGVRAVVDAERELLLNTLKHKPFLIKPNLRELGELFGEKPATLDEIAALARRLREMGAQNVLVSMAGDGALLLDERGELHFQKALKITLVNSVGAGDAMVAGFLAALEKRPGDYEYALSFANETGAAKAAGG
ncbi:MAG: 1-phosphofructokinase [Oscillospiraceae bacterium]|nr:1-phosphofructokinase [Oscillospiraceae bacterium]